MEYLSNRLMEPTSLRISPSHYGPGEPDLSDHFIPHSNKVEGAPSAMAGLQTGPQGSRPRSQSEVDTSAA